MRGEPIKWNWSVDLFSIKVEIQAAAYGPLGTRRDGKGREARVPLTGGMPDRAAPSRAVSLWVISWLIMYVRMMCELNADIR